MSVTPANRGRLGNQIIRNTVVSIIAKRFDLYVDYSNPNDFKELGIDLYCGKNKYPTTLKLTDDNYFDILKRNELKENIDSYMHFFQTKEISIFLYLYFNLERIKLKIMEANPFKERYNNNNDLFVHVRLGDVVDRTPKVDYYLESIEKFEYNNLYIGSDSINHEYIKQIKNKYPLAILIDYSPVKTIQFGSTCKKILLSHGTFSACIGWFGFYSKIYYPKFDRARFKWFGDMFYTPGWKSL